MIASQMISESQKEMVDKLNSDLDLKVNLKLAVFEDNLLNQDSNQGQGLERKKKRELEMEQLMKSFLTSQEFMKKMFERVEKTSNNTLKDFE